MIKLWKLRREASRVWQQITSVFLFLFEFIRQVNYDKNVSRNIQVFPGVATNSDRYAIVLNFQPHGICASSRFTCEHLTQHGYNVLFVSNAKLESADLNVLTTKVWRVMVRPNFGYDFGGYRDAILWLKTHTSSPQKIIMLNDSTWYPVYSNDQFLRHATESSADFIGALQLNKVRDESYIFFESYLYAFSHHLYVNPVFSQFWKKYLLSDIKYRAVKFGERKFSRVLINNGVVHEGVFTLSKFLTAVRSQNCGFLLKTLVYAAYIDDDKLIENQQLQLKFEESPAWHRLAMAHIQRVAHRRHFHASFCYASITLLGVPFLKKSYTPLHISMRKQFVKAVLNGDLPYPSCVEMFAEIRQRDQ